MNRMLDTQFWQYSHRRGWIVRERVRSAIACPHCSGLLFREPRRWIDRLLSSRQSHYQCASIECGWEGNLLTASATAREATSVLREIRKAGESGWRGLQTQVDDARLAMRHALIAALSRLGK